jgi:hypothetical protein
LRNSAINPAGHFARRRQIVRFGLLSTLTLAGMLHWMMPEASAAPVMPAAMASVMPESSADLVYYYQGHHYPYRYGGHYYSHRAYGQGHWRYY